MAATPPLTPQTAFIHKIANCLECPVCFHLPRDPKEMGMCKRGHLVCVNCIKEIHNMQNNANNRVCPTCRTEPMTEETPIVLQQIFQELLGVHTLACRHSHQGCSALDLGLAMAQHEKTCLYRPFSCPNVACIETHTLQQVARDERKQCFGRMGPQTRRGHDIDVAMTDIFNGQSKLHGQICKIFFLPDLETEIPIFVKIERFIHGIKIEAFFLAEIKHLPKSKVDAMKGTLISLGLSARCKSMGAISSLTLVNFLDTPPVQIRSLLVGTDTLKNWCLVMGASWVAPETFTLNLDHHNQLDPAGAMTTVCPNKTKHLHLSIKMVSRMDTIVLAPQPELQRMG